MIVGRVKQINRYPVKSMAGESLESVEIGEQGLVGDRAWAVRDEVRGGIRGAKKIPALMGLGARYASEPEGPGSSLAEITLPGGATLSTGADDVNERLSEAVGQAISLWPLRPAEDLAHYERGAPTHDDMLEELRSVFGREPDEPLPDLGIFPPEIMKYESPPGTYFDAFPLLLMTDASLRTMQERNAGSRFDVRRFRPNFLIEAEDEAEPFPELAWRGGQLAVGGAVIRVIAECPRCVMVTHGFEDLPKDPKIMRSLVQQAEGCLGVYGGVEKPGVVRVGDPIEWTPAD